MHIGVDCRSGLAHSAVVTAANVHDEHPLPDLLHGNEQRVYGHSAHASQKTLMGSKAPKARDFTNRRVRRGGEIDKVERSKKHTKSKAWTRVAATMANELRRIARRPRSANRCTPGCSIQLLVQRSPQHQPE